MSHETVYRFVYAQLKRTNDRRWRHYLPRAKYKRGWRTRWLASPDRPRSIHERPADIATRQQARPFQPSHFNCESTPGSSPG